MHPVLQLNVHESEHAVWHDLRRLPFALAADRQADGRTGERRHEADGVRRRGHLRRACVLDREDGQRRAGNSHGTRTDLLKNVCTVPV